MGILDRLRSLLGFGPSRPAQLDPAEAPPLPASPAGIGPSSDPTEGDAEAARSATFARRDAFWAGIGTVESDVLGNLISPSFTGGPHWPTTRQAYRVVRRPQSILLATDGMSDPFDRGDTERNGFGMELFIETADIDSAFRGEPGNIARLKESWAFQILMNVGQTVAGAGGITERLEQYGTLSIEIPGVGASQSMVRQLPEGYIAGDESLGILLGNPAPDFDTVIADMPLSPVRMVPVVILREDELSAIREGGRQARDDIAARLAALPSGHRCTFDRPSVAP